MFGDSARSVISAARIASTSISPPSSSVLELLGGQHALQLGGDLPGLRRVRLVGDDGEPSCPSGPVFVADLVQREREGLDGDDDDQLAVGQRLGQQPGLRLAPALRASSRSMATTMPLVAVDLPDRVLQLGVEHGAVGDDDDRVEDLLVVDRAAAPAGARSRRSSWSCRTRPSAGSGSGARRPRRATASMSSVTASHWWKRGNSSVVRLASSCR